MIDLRVPRTYALGFPLLSVAGFAVWIALAPSLDSIVIGGAGIASFAGLEARRERD